MNGAALLAQQACHAGQLARARRLAGPPGANRIPGTEQSDRPEMGQACRGLPGPGRVQRPTAGFPGVQPCAGLPDLRPAVRLMEWGRSAGWGEASAGRRGQCFLEGGGWSRQSGAGPVSPLQPDPPQTGDDTCLNPPQRCLRDHHRSRCSRATRGPKASIIRNDSSRSSHPREPVRCEAQAPGQGRTSTSGQVARSRARGYDEGRPGDRRARVRSRPVWEANPYITSLRSRPTRGPERSSDRIKVIR